MKDETCPPRGFKLLSGLCRIIMGMEGLEELYRRYIDEMARFAFQEFSVLRVLKDQSGALDTVDVEDSIAGQKVRLRGAIRHEIATAKRGFSDELAVLLEALASEAPVEERFGDFVDQNPFYGRMDEESADAFRRELQWTYERSASALEPLVGEDDVWQWLRRHWSLDGAHHRLMRWFDTAPRYQDFADGCEMTLDTSGVTLVPMDTVDYAREAARVLDRGHDYMNRVVRADIEAAYMDRELPTYRASATAD